MAVFERQLEQHGWQKGRWKPWKHPVFPGPVFKDTVAFPCGGCDRLMALPNHRVAADGSVAPSVVCPHGCGWHVFLLLKDWKRVESSEQQEARQ